MEYLLDESSRVGEVVVIADDDVAVVVTAAAAASRQPPTYGILCLLFVCESYIFLLSSLSLRERERHDTIQCKPFFLPTRDLSIALSLTHSLDRKSTRLNSSHT